MECHAPHVVTRVVLLAAGVAYIIHESVILLTCVGTIAAVHGMLVAVDGITLSLGLVVTLGWRGVVTFLYLHIVAPTAGGFALGC